MPKGYYAIKKTSNPKKATAWKWFSKYIRLRDALKTTGTTTHARCITCGHVYPMEKIHAGHAIAGRYNSILFHEALCNGQCETCNCNGGGEYQAYKRILIERHGQAKWDFWESMKNRHVEYSQFDYEQLAREYRLKAKELIK